MTVTAYGPITPLDPDSPDGRATAARMTRILDDIDIEIAARRALAATRGQQVAATALIETPAPSSPEAAPAAAETGVAAPVGGSGGQVFAPTTLPAVTPRRDSEAA